ncbi:hypothetical protein R6Q59_006340 [Mikania micrantha]
MFLCGANDLITIFVAPECFSLCSYLLSGYTKKDVRSNEATMKYLLMGGASSSILVHGFSWLYGSSGGEIELQEIVNGLINTQMYNSPGISIALIFITVGIEFKLSPAPSHQWTPDLSWADAVGLLIWASSGLNELGQKGILGQIVELLNHHGLGNRFGPKACGLIRLGRMKVLLGQERLLDRLKVIGPRHSLGLKLGWELLGRMTWLWPTELMAE